MKDSQTQEDPLAHALLHADIPATSKIVVAVSGGPDSVALLDTFVHLVSGGKCAWSLLVGHINHRLRGTESDEDERFVRSVAEERGVDVRVLAVQTREYAVEHRISVQVAARELRARALREMLLAWEGDLIATGHTQDDQAETFLLRLLRGSGLRGLSAMRQREGRIVRPFLGISRATILDTLERRGQTYRIDSSNSDERYRRNQVRQEVLPILAKAQPRTVEVLARTAALIQLDSDYLTAQATQSMGLLEVVQREDETSAAIGPWKALHTSLQRHVLRLLTERLLGHIQDVHESHVSSMQEVLRQEEPSSERLALPRGLILRRHGLTFCLSLGERHPAVTLREQELPIPGEVETVVGTLTAQVQEIDPRDEFERLLVVCGPLHAFCDSRAIGTGLLIRSRVPGDRMRPLGAPGRRKLQDIMVDAHIARENRDCIPILVNEDGIVWIPGLALDQRVAVKPETQHVVHLRFRPK